MKKTAKAEEQYPDLVEAIEEATGLKLEKERLLHPDKPPRTKGNFQFDYALPDQMIAIEVEGGIFQAKGGHSSIKGIHRDITKYNAATVKGWRVLRITAKEARSGKGQAYMVNLIMDLLWKEAPTT